MSSATENGGGWLRDPAAIYARSFEIIAREADFAHLPPQTHHIAARVIHACGLPQLAADLRISPGLQQAAQTSLRQGCDVFVDTEMTRAGIMQRLLPATVRLRCLLREEETRQMAERRQTTLTAAVVERWTFLPGRAICVIGNAPTALFRLMERMAAGELEPVAVLAFPVGFVGAAESKQAFREMMRQGWEGATMLGRAGGAGMAAAALNAILLAAHAAEKPHAGT